jgi:hypothetical protein
MDRYRVIITPRDNVYFRVLDEEKVVRVLHVCHAAGRRPTRFD